MSDVVSCSWREQITDDEMVELVASHGGRVMKGWWDKVQQQSLGWVAARDQSGLLVGFVNVAWDGGDHAFLLDTKTAGSWRRRGIGTEIVRQAARHAWAAGCEWLHVDFESHLAPFYFDACSFRSTEAGLIHLRSLQ